MTRSHHGEYFYIRTNDGAKNFRLMRTEVSDPSTENWEEVIPARADVTIEGVDSFEDHIVVYERERGLEKICIRDGEGANFHYIEFPEPVYTRQRHGQRRIQDQSVAVQLHFARHSGFGV